MKGVNYGYLLSTISNAKGYIIILQALVYDILLSTTAINDYTISLGKLSANGQILVGDQITVYLQQTSQSKVSKHGV